MALIAGMGSLASGMPLASMFKVYKFIMCEVYGSRKLKGADTGAGTQGSSWDRMGAWAVSALQQGVGLLGINLPPAPELPHPPQCNDPWVEKATSTYAAAMTTTGALLGLIVLEKAVGLSRHFGRKPVLLMTHLVVLVGLLGFRLAVTVNEVAGAAVLAGAVVLSEAAAGAPTRIAIQNYVVDTTTDSQRAPALSFIDGFAQIGGFPSSALGGLLAALTGEFFAPFYAGVAAYLLIFAYILVFVPESKANRHHTLIDSLESSGTKDNDGTDGDCNSVSDGTSLHSAEPQTWKGRMAYRLRSLNFISPLAIFLPRRQHGHGHGHGEAGAGHRQGKRDWRLFNLALIVVAEETYQVFLVPTMLLYTSNRFGYDVVLNGYLISLLQGTRAVFLTLIFPPAFSKLRSATTGFWARRRARKEKKRAAEAEPLNPADTEEDRRGYGSIASRDYGNEAGTQSSAQQQQQQQQHDHDDTVSETGRSEVPSIVKREERGKLDISIMALSYLLAIGAFVLLGLARNMPGLAAGLVILQLGSGVTSVRTALIVNAVPESEQTKALAANQILVTVVGAVCPLLTSVVYGAGLNAGTPNLVWFFKALFAAISFVLTLVLFASHHGRRTPMT